MSGTFVGDLLTTVVAALGVAFAGLVAAPVIASAVMARRRRPLRRGTA